MATVLITGATGFVGSSLAAYFLHSGFKVLALSRNDVDGQRTRTSVADAAQGFNLPIDDALIHQLRVLEVDNESIEQQLSPAVLSEVHVAWHAAAEMSYASQKALTSYHTNAVATAQLYKLLATRATQCKRFFYVSTAYTGGMRGGAVDEELHAGQPYDNVYQLTKCATEHALVHLQKRHELPVTIFRPSIVVGHSGTGWARRNGFGFHMFIEALAMIGRAGVSKVHLNLNANARPDLIPIDQLVHNATRLTQRPDQGYETEIIHCTGGLGLSLQEVLCTIGQYCGVDVQFGRLQSSADRRVDRAIELNRRFADTEWMFSSEQLQRAIGCGPRPAVNALELERMVSWYLAGDVLAGRRKRKSNDLRHTTESKTPESLETQPA